MNNETRKDEGMNEATTTNTGTGTGSGEPHQSEPVVARKRRPRADSRIIAVRAEDLDAIIKASGKTPAAVRKSLATEGDWVILCVRDRFTIASQTVLKLSRKVKSRRPRDADSSASSVPWRLD